jgi:hypothetical protein
MCFSASASFTAGVLLTVIGTETIKKIHKPSQIIFGFIPVFFALQQFSEGVIWLCAGRPGYSLLQSVMTHFFMVMAQMVWPLMIPLSVLLMEVNKAKKRIISYMLATGAVTALYYLAVMMVYKPFSEVIAMHVRYNTLSEAPFGRAAVMLYLAATLVPLFVSSVKKAHVLGMIAAAALVVSGAFYIECLTSVWCFFAAVMSFVVYYILNDSHAKFRLDMIAKAVIPRKKRAKSQA